MLKLIFYNKQLKYFVFNFLCSEKGRQNISIPTDRMSVLPHKLTIIVRPVLYVEFRSRRMQFKQKIMKFSEVYHLITIVLFAFDATKIRRIKQALVIHAVLKFFRYYVL